MVRRRDVVNRESIHVKPFVVEHRLRHRELFEYEYEYEYELLSTSSTGLTSITVSLRAISLQLSRRSAKPFMRSRCESTHGAQQFPLFPDAIQQMTVANRNASATLWLIRKVLQHNIGSKCRA